MIKKFTERFLNCSRVALFILFGFIGFNWYSSSDPMPAQVSTVVNLIGTISFIAWVYAIGNRANERLQKRKISLGIFKFFNLGFVVMIACVLIMFFLSEDRVSFGNNSGSITYHLSYTKPLWAAVVLLVSLLFTVVVAAKTLVSAEQNKEAVFGDYFTTLLMFTFSWIGLWFIQPRVQKL